jgi:hypothetical protein
LTERKSSQITFVFFSGLAWGMGSTQMVKSDAFRYGLFSCSHKGISERIQRLRSWEP